MSLSERRTKPLYPRLQEGENTCTILALDNLVVKTDPQTNQVIEYYPISFQFPTGRILKENRFEAGWAALISQLQQQFNDDNNYPSEEDFIKTFISNSTPIKVWVEVKDIITKTGELKTVTNLNFLPPKQTPTASTSTASEAPSALAVF